MWLMSMHEPLTIQNQDNTNKVISTSNNGLLIVAAQQGGERDNEVFLAAGSGYEPLTDRRAIIFYNGVKEPC